MERSVEHGCTCGLTYITSLYQGKPDEFKSFQTLSREFALHLQSCCGSQTDPLQQSFIDIVLQRDNYAISSLYEYLITHQSDKYLAPFQKCFAIFNDNTLPERILEGYRHIHKLTISETWRETQFQIIHRAYYLFRTNEAGSTQAQCPWCSLPYHTLLHRLWECPTITRYWNLVPAHIFKINNIQLPNNPLLCIFGCEPLPSTSSSAGSLNLTQWTHITLLVARRTIMSHWIKPTPPSLPAVECSMLSFFNLERLNTIVLNFRSTSRFFARWCKYYAPI